MSFTVPHQFTQYVSLQNIANSSQGQETCCLTVALNEARDNKSLPGVQDDYDVSICTGNVSKTNVFYNNNTIVTLCDVFVCGYEYGTDNESDIKIALQNIGGIKPTEAFTATLTYKG